MPINSRRQVVRVGFPLLGKVENVGYEQQPPQTTPDCLNVLPFDALEDRARGGKRSGLSRHLRTAVNGSNHIQTLLQVTRVTPTKAVVPDEQKFLDRYDRPGNPSVVDGVIYEGHDEAVALGTFPNPWATGGDPDAWHETGNDNLTPDIGEGSALSENVALGLKKKAISLRADEAYVVRAKLTTVSGIITVGNAEYHAGIAIRLDVSSEEYYGVEWWREDGVDEYAIRIISHTSSGSPTVVATSGSLGATDDDEHDLEARINKDFIEVFWDGQRHIITTLPDSATNFDSDDHQRIGLFVIRRKGAGGGDWTQNDNVRFDDFEILTGTEPPSLRENRLIVVSGGAVYGTSADQDQVTLIDSSAVTDALRSDAPAIMAAFGFQRVFFVDGKTYHSLDLSTGVVTDWEADGMDTLPGGDASTAATDTTERARIVTVWDGRVLLSGLQTLPHNIYGSRRGDPDDWDLTAPDENGPFQMVADTTLATASPVGVPGGIVTALAPWRGRQLLIGTDRNIFSLSGNPNANLAADSPNQAQFHSLTEAVGIVGPYAWTIGKDRTLYFVGQDGFYALSPNQFSIDKTNRMSRGKMDSFFRDINHTTHRVMLVWDSELHGVHIFVTPIAEGITTHVFFDSRTEGFFPIRYPKQMGPTAAMVLDSDDPGDRAVLLGGHDSIVRNLDRSASWDDGTAIETLCILGPLRSPWAMREFGIAPLMAVLDENSGTVDFDVLSGDTAEGVLVGSAVHSGTWAAGRNAPVWSRARGSAAAIRLQETGSKTRWALEYVEAGLTEGSPLRLR